MMNDNEKKVLENSNWDLATCLNGKPNVVPVASKSISKSGELLIGDVFLVTTLKNVLENNGEIAISAYDASILEGYQIQGKAKYVTEGDVVDMFKEQVSSMFKGAATAKGALIVSVDRVIVTTPGAENKKVL